MADLNLRELDRLEQEMQGKVMSTNVSEIHEQLRPLLDLVEKLGEALYRITPQRDTRPDLQGFDEAQTVLDDYRRARGE